MSNTNADNSAITAEQIAASSGLFAPQSPATTPSNSKSQKHAKTPKTREKREINSPTAQKSGVKRHSGTGADTDGLDTPKEQGSSDRYDPLATIDLSNEQEIYAAIKAAVSNTLKFSLSRRLAREFKRYASLGGLAGKASHARGELATADELSTMISDALRDPSATASDKKALISALQSVAPHVFDSSDRQLRPDPCAIIGYLCGWSGMSGEQIVAELGGREFIADKLSQTLKVPVVIG